MQDSELSLISNKINLLKYIVQLLEQMVSSAALLLLVCIILLSFSSAQNTYTLQLLPTDRGARCLDGTPIGLYYHEGTGANKNKFMIYMNSGGFCNGFTVQESLESCYRRSKGNLGSSAYTKPQRSFDNQGLLSTLAQNNPVFYDWTKIYFIYCDGSEYTGSRDEPISYKDTQLYFRGYNNVLEQFRFLDQRFDFYNKEAIVLTGVSAGGMGTFFYSNYLMENTKTSKVYAIPDSGLFLVDYLTPTVSKQVLRAACTPLFNLINNNNKGFPITQCAQQNKDDIIQCYTTSNLTKYLKAPMLIVESPYDAYSIENAVYTQCLQNKQPPYSLLSCNQATRDAIEDYRTQVIAAIKKIKGNRKDVGLWAPSCVQHGYTDDPTFTNPNFRVPSGTGPMIHEAIRQFLNDPDNAPWYFDEVQWPYNTNCNGITTNLRLD